MSAWVSGYQYTLMQTLYLITAAPYSQELGYPARSGPFKHPGGPSSSYSHSFAPPPDKHSKRLCNLKELARMASLTAPRYRGYTKILTTLFWSASGQSKRN